MTESASAAPRVVIWGSELSPFTLKLRSLCQAAGVSARMLPEEGGRLENYRALVRIELAKRRRTAVRYPALSDLDEYPLVPFLLTDSGVYYDSSALARWLDDRHPTPAGPLLPNVPALGFAAQLIDEAFDEFGLYMVHHARWVVSARTNDAGVRLAREFARVIPPWAGAGFAERFSRRQVRRLPYLFSVAPPSGDADGLPPGRTPPSPQDFPPTHRLIEHAWEAYLDGVDTVLQEQPFLLGDRFTLADASAYGQLGMNLNDPEAAELIRRRTPVTYRWLCAIRDGEQVGRRGAVRLSPRLRGLMDAIARTFVPLMAQNAAAYDVARAAGETLFNEAGFDRGRAIYRGTLLGLPFRSVVKTFQVRVWHELLSAWAMLDEDARAQVRRVLPPGGPFDA